MPLYIINPATVYLVAGLGLGITIGLIIYTLYLIYTDD